jgi:hypothetical protein
LYCAFRAVTLLPETVDVPLHRLAMDSPEAMVQPTDRERSAVDPAFTVTSP